MGSRTVLYFTLFLAIAGVAGIFARAYFSDQSAVAAAPPEPQGPKIIMAARDLEVGAFLTADDIKWQAVQSQDEVILSQHFIEGAASFDTLLGAVVRRRVHGDTPVTAAQIVKPGQRGFLAAVLRPGMRAVTVEIDKVSGNSGLIFPGDYIDLILTLELKAKDDRLSRRLASETILRNVRVIAIGQRVESFASVEATDESGGRIETTATLEVAPQHAERIHVAQQIGRLALSLRSLADDNYMAANGGDSGSMPGPLSSGTPSTSMEDLKAKTTWASDVSAALRLQEQGLAKPPPPKRKYRPRKRQTLTVMRGGERKVVTQK